ncbi:secreted seminal-vesicle Ly-6 protein 1-like [Fukomys damarensis]|uniref:secreted seminal-vesicle Ly-6 protein 1-like n=1 Tax=Fukomys damarensis TaxID=885580 RepID=UPI0005402E68|nr:secreted seminal-vesicle Ly-6 protein 1-like [Fukomys damarensis]
MSMGKYLLLFLGLALLSYLGQALICVQCDRRNSDGVCETGEHTCQAYGSQQCSLRKIYEGDKFVYGRQGCSTLCSPMTLFSPTSRVQFLCCQDASFCNKL